MRKIVCLLIIACVLGFSTQGSAWQLKLAVLYESDGAIASEVWYDGERIWQLKLYTGEAIPVSSGKEQGMFVLVPTIVDGLFMFKLVK